MKVVILCGGMGLRMGKQVTPKPLMHIGNRPIVWHIMKQYAHYGYNEFVLCLGYNGHVIRDYFFHHCYNHSDVLLNTRTGEIEHLSDDGDDFKITLVDTGQESPTGSRIKQIEKYIDTDDFFVTYGDGVSDLNIADLYSFHKKNAKIATMTGVLNQSQFGNVECDGNVITGFQEKGQTGGWINGGFFVLNRRVFDYLTYDTMFEEAPLKELVADEEVVMFKSEGFWSCMDTQKDCEVLNKMLEVNDAPWQVWKHGKKVRQLV